VTGRIFRGLRHSAAVAAACSFLLPGLGEAYAGARRRGLLLALPVVLLVFLAALLVLLQGPTQLLGSLLQPNVLLALLGVNLALLLYRFASQLDAYLIARRTQPPAPRGRRAGSVAVLSLLLLVTVGMHAWVGVVTYKTYDLVNSVFGAAPSETPEPTLMPTPAPTVTPGSPAASPTATPRPTPTPAPLPAWARNGRLDVLLVGGDAGPGRYSLRTDTMILVSVDLASNRAKLFGIPRNLINVPLPGAAAKAFRCGCFPDLLNALYVYASKHPELFPGDDSVRGYHAVETTVGELTGVHVDGMVVVKLNGFVKLVDALGGLDITIPAPLYDSHYPLEDGSGDVAISFSPGKQHLNGHLALAYARSRHQDDDYHRMQRQQLVLLALRRQLNPCTLVPRLPELLDIAKDSLWTDLSLHDLPDLLAVARAVDLKHVAQGAFVPPYIPEVMTPLGLERIRAMVANAFVADPSASPTPVEIPDADSLPSC
jgi:LCP family protein required for cell wall assembly